MVDASKLSLVVSTLDIPAPLAVHHLSSLTGDALSQDVLLTHTLDVPNVTAVSFSMEINVDSLTVVSFQTLFVLNATKDSFEIQLGNALPMILTVQLPVQQLVVFAVNKDMILTLMEDALLFNTDVTMLMESVLHAVLPSSMFLLLNLVLLMGV